MRLKAIYAKDVEPIKLLRVEELSDLVVLAGPNGVGKTRFVNEVLNVFQNPRTDGPVTVVVEATTPSEEADWGKKQIDTSQHEDIAKFQITLQRNRRRGKWQSSVLNFDSNRMIEKVDPYQFNWHFGDPFAEEIGWNFGIRRLANRFKDTLHSLFRMVRSRKEAISTRVLELIELQKMNAKADGNPNANTILNIDYKEFPDPLDPFKAAFSKLLAPKQLLDADPIHQQLRYSIDGMEFNVATLSSGEQEVVNIVFDFLLRNPSDCIVVFDEPELHLHPELSYRLIQTLKTAGERNQFVFCTHSADIITSSLDNSVIFIAPPQQPIVNQAIVVREDDKTHHALKLLGQSIGIVSLGRKIVLIEGDHTSLDKQTYGVILKDRFPDLVLVPSGGKNLIRSFSAVQKHVLDESLWGVSFFMLCDRDAIPALASPADLTAASSGRLQTLKRYHLENYFLNEECIAEMFTAFEPDGGPLREPGHINEILREIARGMLSYVVALTTAAHFRERVGNVDLMPEECHEKSVNDVIELLKARAASEQARTQSMLDVASIERFSKETAEKLTNSLDNNTVAWRFDVPGKPIVSKFCNRIGFDVDRFKLGYIRTAEKMPESPFAEVVSIFSGFSEFKHR